jgi:hypothetical protein
MNCVHNAQVHCRGKACIQSSAIPIIIEGQFQVFQRFSSSKLVLKTVESCFAALNYHGNGSTLACLVFHRHFQVFTHTHTYQHTYICILHGCIHTIVDEKHAYTHMHACIHTYIHTYAYCRATSIRRQTCIHTYIHTYIWVHPHNCQL